MLTRGLIILFALTIASDTAAQADRATQPRGADQGPSPRARVVCGTTIFSADPRMDQGILKPTPSGNFTLRTLRPPVCRNTFAVRTDDVKLRLPYFLGPKR